MDWRTEKSTASKCNFVNEKLTFVARDRNRGEGAHTARGFWDIAHTFRAARVCHELNPKQNPTSFFRKLRLRAVERGSILVEFAICMPILIILLFYINDLVKIKRYYSQTEFVAQQMANIIQNISQKRENKKITANDLKYAAALAWLTVYPGTTMYTAKSGNAPINACPWVQIYCIKGLPENKASCLWAIKLFCRDITVPVNWQYISFTSSLGSDSGISYSTNATPSTIYSTLKINEGEYKLIIENLFNWNTTFACTNDKRAFNLRLINPKGNNRWVLFPSVIIFTPKPRLFDATPPK